MTWIFNSKLINQWEWHWSWVKFHCLKSGNKVIRGFLKFEINCLGKSIFWTIYEYVYAWFKYNKHNRGSSMRPWPSPFGRARHAHSYHRWKRKCCSSNQRFYTWALQQVVPRRWKFCSLSIAHSTSSSEYELEVTYLYTLPFQCPQFIGFRFFPNLG